MYIQSSNLSSFLFLFFSFSARFGSTFRARVLRCVVLSPAFYLKTVNWRFLSADNWRGVMLCVDKSSR